MPHLLKPHNRLPSGELRPTSKDLTGRSTTSAAHSAAFLSELDRRAVENRRQREALVAKLTRGELETLQWLEHQFSNLDQLFAALAAQETGWVQSQPVGDWLRPSLDRPGYSLNAGAEENWKAGAPYPHRWLIVSCTVRSPDDPYWLLYPQENPQSPRKEQSQPKGLLPWGQKGQVPPGRELIEQVNNRVFANSLVISLHHRDIGQLHRKIPLEKVDGGNLAPLCTKLFRALMGDDLEKLKELGSEHTPKPPLLGFLKR